MGIGRRDLLKILGGSAAGAVFTPAPWKMLADSAIWSQNWSWIPRPPRGEEKIQYTTCTLCPASCGVRARCIGGQPVALAGVAGHPVSRGVLCPLGVGAHQLPFHPRRYTQVLKRGKPATLEAAIAETGAALAEARQAAAGQTVAVLDTRPGRTLSHSYRQFLATFPHGVYIGAHGSEGATLDALAGMLEGPAAPLGLNLEGTRTVLSFGAPILDGWATPGRVLAARPNFRLIQAEARQSRTAAAADDWLPLRPGSEAALALGLAHLLLADRRISTEAARRASDCQQFQALATEFPPERTAAVTGLDAPAIRRLAETLVSAGPALCTGGGDPGGGPLGKPAEVAIAALNLLCGAMGSTIVTRRELPKPRETRVGPKTCSLMDVPDHSIGVLVVDGSGFGDSIPWQVFERKLRPGSIVLSLAAFPDAISERADFVIPVPVWLETLDEAPSPFDAPVASFAVSHPFTAAPKGTIEPDRVLARFGGPDQTAEARLKARAGAIFASRRGYVFLYADGSRKPVREFESAEKFWQALADGACWRDDETVAAPAPRYTLTAGDTTALRAAAEKTEASGAPGSLALLPFGWRGATATMPVETAKLYQESGLRPAGHHSWMNPQTAASCGLDDTCTGVLETAAGSCEVTVHVDQAVMPGVMHVAVGPEGPLMQQGRVLDICDPDGDCNWRIVRAKAVKA